MNVVQNLISDLREKRLWPIAMALIVALVAVPVLLSSGGTNPVPVAAIPATGLPSSAPVPAVPAVSVTATPSNARLTGARRDPFTQQVKASSKSTGAKTTPSRGSSKSQGSSSAAKKSTGSTTSGAVGGSTTTVSSTPTRTRTPTPTPPRTPPPPIPAGLRDNQAYHVTVAVSTTADGLYTIDPVARLSLLPSEKQPMLIELGVLNGGHRVLFVVQPGTVVRGPGRCTPGPIDCELISLAPSQTEWVGTSGPSGLADVGLMAVAAIEAADYSSSAKADKARATESAAGRRLLNKSQSAALSLFRYRPSLGALVGLSNVTVGGS